MDADVIVIGSGQAGVPLADRLARAGSSVILVERAALGGTCTNYGCTPTKTMVASARAAHVVRTAGRLGVHASDVRVDFEAVVRRKDAVVKTWREGVERRLARAGERLRVVRGHARFVGPREIAVGSERLRAETVIVNVGARPIAPPIEGLASTPYLDNHALMNLRALPSHLVVIGGGYVGCEFAQMFRRFGAAVTIVSTGPRLLDREDPEVSDELAKAFRAESIGLEFGAKTTRVSRAGDEVVLSLASGKEIRGSHLLVATGRRPNTDDLGCDAGGIALDKRGFIVVDDAFATSAKGVYAVGDVTDEPQFTHTSWDDHRILFERLKGRESKRRSQRTIPYTVFTDPQVAGVGLREREARAKGVPFEVASLPYSSVARALEVDEPAGLLKVLIDPKTERILGATIVGAEAGELIHVFVAMIEANASARAIVDAEFVHPTYSEGVQSVVMALPRYQLT